MSNRKEYDVQIIVLRKYGKEDSHRDFSKQSKKPMFVIQSGENLQEIARGASYAYSKIEAVNKLSQELINIHNDRVQLVCNYRRVGEHLYYAADFMVEHHNDLVDRVNPVLNKNPSPFTARFPPSRTIPQHIETVSSLDDLKLGEEDEEELQEA